MTDKTTEALKRVLSYVEQTAQFIPHDLDDEGIAVAAILRKALAETVNQELNWGANKFMPHEQPVKQEELCEDEGCPHHGTLHICFSDPSALTKSVKQEPVGVVESSEEWGVAGVLIAGLPIGTKLYAAPVERQWVDLTDDEIWDCDVNTANAHRVIAAFKEKNK